MTGAADAIVETGLLGGVVVCLLALTAARSRGVVRLHVAAAALAFALWTAGCLGLLAGLPDGAFWGLVRPAVVGLLAFSTMHSPGPARSRREWFEILLDGWMTVAGAFGAIWVLVIWQPLIPERAGLSWSMLWLVVQVLIMVPVAGLLARAPAGHRLGSAVALLVGLVVLFGDTLGLVTGNAQLGIPFWLGGGAVLGMSVLARGPEVFSQTFGDAETLRAVRLWQLPLPFLVLFIALPTGPGGPAGPGDPVLQAAITAVSTSIFVQLIFRSARSEQLWTRLVERNRLYQDLLRDSVDAMILVDDQGVVEFANPATGRLLALDPAELVGTLLRDREHPEDRQKGFGAARTFDWTAASSFQVVTRHAHAVTGPDGSSQVEWRPIEWTVAQRGDAPAEGPRTVAQRAAGWVLSGRDISERVRLEAGLAEAARTDALTGLLNRGAFLAEVDARLADGQPVAVIFLDLDKFKAVNDTLGHAQGDLLLRAAAENLTSATGPGDRVARLGGDEFAVLAESSDPVDVVAVGQAVIAAFTGFDAGAVGRPSVSASVGIRISATGTAVELLRDADLAMYRAKLRGGSAVVLFEPWMSERVMEHSRLRADLEAAVRDQALTLYLQPVVRLDTGDWAGFEALVRWPVGRETWSPEQFLPVAEESGLIVPMGGWVLREALRQLADWRDDRLGMAVNVSALQLVGTDLFDIAMDALASSGIAADRLTLEITEQAAVQDLGRAASRLDQLRDAGVHVAIDDFGTGFSSMQYLARLPVDILKIDRKFVGGLGQQAEDDVLVRSMIRLAAELGLDVIAEGVETREQADLLLEHGCRLAQGYFFSPPRPFADLRRIRPATSPPSSSVPSVPSVTSMPSVPAMRPRPEAAAPVGDSDRSGHPG